MKTKAIVTCVAMAVLMIGLGAHAGTVTIQAYPSDVPDQAPPELNMGDAPTGFGPDSWRNTDVAGDKVNWHARYDADGSFLNLLFPDDVADLTINDIESISYWTKRPDGTLVGEDWALYIYTRPEVGTSWYDNRFINDYSSHTETDSWTQYTSTDDGGMNWTLNGTKVGASAFSGNLGALKSAHGGERIEMISVQTMTNYADFNGYMDGLTITLTNGNVGIVDFAAPVVPEPATMTLAGIGIAAVALRLRRRRRS